MNGFTRTQALRVAETVAHPQSFRTFKWDLKTRQDIA